jgi:hypothetical protein
LDRTVSVRHCHNTSEWPGAMSACHLACVPAPVV